MEQPLPPGGPMGPDFSGMSPMGMMPTPGEPFMQHPPPMTSPSEDVGLLTSKHSSVFVAFRRCWPSY